jgi:hypothetical protein
MPQVLRIIPERRTGKERRRVFSLHRFFHKGPERRKAPHDRRAQEEILKFQNICIRKKPEPTIIICLFPIKISPTTSLSDST